MPRYLLDTNIVLYIILNPTELERNVVDILEDYNNCYYTSAITVQEIAQLFRKGKIKPRWKKAEDILPAIEAINVEILPLKREHLATYLGLHIPAAHNDPNDHLIIAQAITERITLISSDRQFEHYTKQRLSLIFNNRN